MTQTHTTGIKAIETVYNGYRFRSRLEARWAVFFDTLGIRYEYEKEGYDLGDAGWYLPDFWLPDLSCWVEIKGQPPTQEEQLKIVRMTTLHANCYGVIRHASPDATANEGYGFWQGKFLGYQVFVQCVACGTVGLLMENPDLNILGCVMRCQCRSRNIATDTPKLKAAYEAARQARFEHGETPRPTQIQRTVKPSNALAFQDALKTRLAAEDDKYTFAITSLREYLANFEAEWEARVEEAKDLIAKYPSYAKYYTPEAKTRTRREAEFRLRHSELSQRMAELDERQREVERTDDKETLKTLLTEKQALLSERRRIYAEAEPYLPKSRRSRKPAAPQPSPQPQQIKMPESWSASPLVNLHPGDRVEHWRYGLGVIEHIHHDTATVLFDTLQRLDLDMGYARLKVVTETPTAHKL